MESIIISVIINQLISILLLFYSYKNYKFRVKTIIYIKRKSPAFARPIPS